MTSNLTEAFYRRLYAFYRPSPDVEPLEAQSVEEFYNPSQPRDKDGKWRSGGGRKAGASGIDARVKGVANPTTDKMWTGVSAHPDRRKAPKSSLTFPVDKDDYETQGDANRRFARKVYDTDLGDGYRSSVSRVTVYDNKEMSVQGVITHKGREVGTFDRMISVEKRGKVAVDHTELMISAAHRSKGLADRFNSHAVAQYQEMGVDRITLHAGDSVGGFAWARQGFRWGSPTVAKTVGNKALDMVDADLKYQPKLKGSAGDSVRAEAAALRKALNDGKDVQPIHIASLGEKIKWESTDEIGNRYTNWPGKRAMMRSAWEGVYYFDASDAVTAAASNLEHARLRPQFKAQPAREPIKE